MSATEQLPVAPVPASIDNTADWEILSDQITAATAIPPIVNPEMIGKMIGSAAPLLFAADAARNANLLRGTFADPVVAQCQRNAGILGDLTPVTVLVHLVGSRVVDGHPLVRAHLSIQVHDANGNASVQNHFWDLQFGAQVTVGQPACPNCAPPSVRASSSAGTATPT